MLPSHRRTVPHPLDHLEHTVNVAMLDVIAGLARFKDVTNDMTVARTDEQVRATDGEDRIDLARRGKA
jgi:hypothetical protein